PAPTVEIDTMFGEPRRRAGLEAEGDQHGICRQDHFATRNFLGYTAAPGIRLTHARLHELHARDLAVFTNDFLRLVVEDELHAFLARILDLASRAGHIVLVPAIYASHRGCALANGGAVTVHGGVATTQHDDLFAFHTDVAGQVWLAVTHVFAGVADQKRQCFVDPLEVLAGEAALHGVVGTHAEEDGVVFLQQLLEADVA